MKRLGRITHKDKFKFDALSRVSHVTDATDWRVEYPFVVLTPDNESEMAALVRGCIDLDLSIIQRGGGTDYPGGAFPLSAQSAVFNTEKLDTKAAVEVRQIPCVNEPAHIILTGAGEGDRRGGEP